MAYLRNVWTLYRMEVRGALRDRAVVTNSVLMPVLLYPALLWLASLGVTFAVGQRDLLPSRIAVVGCPPAHRALEREIATARAITLEGIGSAREGVGRVATGALDALVELLPPEGSAGGLPGNFAARITFDTSKERSADARQRVAEIIGRYRDRWLAREAASRGIGAAQWQVFTLTERNVASKKEMGAFFLAQLLPVIFAIMVALGCIHPAIDSTAGERERGTWETLMASPASRGAIVIAKYLAVATFGVVAGVLNFTSMAATLEPVMAPLLRKADIALDVSLAPWAIPAGLLGAVLLAGLAAAGMMLFASFARTFKDGQSTITPFMLLFFFPLLFLQDPSVHLDVRTALVPGANIMLLVRGAILGTLTGPAVAVCITASVLFIAALVGTALFVLRFEDVVVGSYQGTLGTLLTQRLIKRPASGGRR